VLLHAYSYSTHSPVPFRIESAQLEWVLLSTRQGHPRIRPGRAEANTHFRMTISPSSAVRAGAGSKHSPLPSPSKPLVAFASSAQGVFGGSPARVTPTRRHDMCDSDGPNGNAQMSPRRAEGSGSKTEARDVRFRGVAKSASTADMGAYGKVRFLAICQLPLFGANPTFGSPPPWMVKPFRLSHSSGPACGLEKPSETGHSKIATGDWGLLGAQSRPIC
jgi:hypothetical protein